jgi:hypothetical protein
MDHKSFSFLGIFRKASFVADFSFRIFCRYFTLRLLPRQGLLKTFQVEMPPMFSLMTAPAAGIDRIQKTNLPQSPKKCNDCQGEEKWFNTKDGLLVGPSLDRGARDY